MSDYEVNREWSELLIPQIKQIVGPWLLEQAPFDLDTQQVTDLIILTARDLRIGARVRRYGYAEKFPFDFTIRSKLDSGAPTELSKIINGWGDWFFYGHALENNYIDRWWLIDLHAFRAALIRQGTKLLTREKANGDGTHFKIFDVRKFPPIPPILIAGSHERELRTVAA